MKLTKNILILLLFGFTSAQAQIGLATRAFKEMEAGNLTDAKIKIDLALEDPLAVKHPRAQYYYGRIYEEAYTKNTNVEYIVESMHGYIISINLVEDKDVWKDVKERLHKVGEWSREEGVKRFKQKKYDEAEEFFLASMIVARAEERTDSLNYLNIAVTNDKLQEYDRAVLYLDTCIALNFQTYNCAILTLKIYRRQGNQAMIDKKIAQYRSLYPENDDLLLIEINNHLQNNRNKAAVAAATKSVNEYSKNATLYIVRADLYVQLKDIPKAEKDYLKAVSLDSEYFEANFATAEFYAKTDIKKAIPYYEKAYEINPDKDDVGKILLAAYKSAEDYNSYMILKPKIK